MGQFKAFMYGVSATLVEVVNMAKYGKRNEGLIANRFVQPNTKNLTFDSKNRKIPI